MRGKELSRPSKQMGLKTVPGSKMDSSWLTRLLGILYFAKVLTTARWFSQAGFGVEQPLSRYASLAVLMVVYRADIVFRRVLVNPLGKLVKSTLLLPVERVHHV